MLRETGWKAPTPGAVQQPGREGSGSNKHFPGALEASLLVAYKEYVLKKCSDWRKADTGDVTQLCPAPSDAAEAELASSCLQHPAARGGLPAGMHACRLIPWRTSHHYARCVFWPSWGGADVPKFGRIFKVKTCATLYTAVLRI